MMESGGGGYGPPVFVFKTNNLSMKERLFLEEKVEKMYLKIKLINYKFEKKGEF